jgi:hypothetical protein
MDVTDSIFDCGLLCFWSSLHRLLFLFIENVQQLGNKSLQKCTFEEILVLMLTCTLMHSSLRSVQVNVNLNFWPCVVLGYSSATDWFLP